jgi:hypothetical protein
MDNWEWCPAPYSLKQRPTRVTKIESFLGKNGMNQLISDGKLNAVVSKYCTCSLWPCGKYTTRLPTGGIDTRGPAQACHSSELIGFFSPALQINTEIVITQHHV